jgi:DNA-binding MarR family transcriptional regulator
MRRSPQALDRDSHSHTHDRQRLQNLAEFRYTLRQFLHFSESCSADAGLHPQQHQLLLHIAGAPHTEETTISYIAERLGLRHHSVVELSKRCEESGLIHRRHDTPDRRCVTLHITPKGHRVLRALSEAHERELHELVPRLIRALKLIRSSKKPSKSPSSTRATPKGNHK